MTEKPVEPTDSERLTRLEADVASLRAELHQIRGGTPAPRLAPPGWLIGSPKPGTAAPPVIRERLIRPAETPSIDFEQLIGRYGTIVLTTLTALTAVAVFLRWAIAHEMLGPTARVVLGYAAAGALGFVGVRLRQRRSREYGNMVLAVALAVTHLVSWAAGPYLHVLPVAVALGIAAITSGCLVEYARRYEEQALAAVGFGGAAVAPFIISSDSHNVVALGVYGLVLIALAFATIGERRWPVVRRVALMAVLTYVGALIAGTDVPDLPLPTVAKRMAVIFPALVVFALAVLARGSNQRAGLRIAAFGAVLGALGRASSMGRDDLSAWITVVTAAVSIVGLYLARPPRAERVVAKPGTVSLDGYSPVLDALLIPAALLAGAMTGINTLPSVVSAVLAGVWLVAMLFASDRTAGEAEAEPFAIAATFAAVLLAPAAVDIDRDTIFVATQTVIALVLVAALTRMPRKALGFGVIVAMAIPSAISLAVLMTMSGSRFRSDLFFTKQSLSVAIVVAGWAAAHVLLSRVELARWPARDEALLAVRVGFFGVAFFWVREVFGSAWNETVSTALLVLYYAITGFAAIHFGRVRRRKWLRVGGLVLTVLAAKNVLVAAWEIDNVVVRVGLLLAVSGFLLVVAYWYRRGGPTDGVPGPAAVPATS